MNSSDVIPDGSDSPETKELLKALSSGRWGKYGRFVLAALGSLPWVGGLLSGAASLQAESAQATTNELLRRWIQEHEGKARRLATMLARTASKLDQLGEEPTRRVEDAEYLDIVRKGFRVWDRSDTDQKRELVRKVLTNAAAVRLTSDDVVRLFLDWIEKYHEIHFSVIAAIHQHPGSTRSDIWNAINGADVRDDSAEADLFKLLIRDLTTGGVIRQHRETNAAGEFISQRKGPRRGPVLKSPFDGAEEYELTALGRQFVHYAMNEIVPRIEGQRAAPQ